VVPLRDLHKQFAMDEAEVAEAVRDQFRDYRVRSSRILAVEGL